MVVADGTCFGRPDLGVLDVVECCNLFEEVWSQNSRPREPQILKNWQKLYTLAFRASLQHCHLEDLEPIQDCLCQDFPRRVDSGRPAKEVDHRVHVDSWFHTLLPESAPLPWSSSTQFCHWFFPTRLWASDWIEGPALSFTSWTLMTCHRTSVQRRPHPPHLQSATASQRPFGQNLYIIYIYVYIQHKPQQL